jgi:hypothetical protein
LARAAPIALAVLDGQFAVRAGRWPCVTSRICERIAQRARHLAVAEAVTHLPRAHPRLLLLLWLLADRWGRVTTEGCE